MMSSSVGGATQGLRYFLPDFGHFQFFFLFFLKSDRRVGGWVGRGVGGGGVSVGVDAGMARRLADDSGDVSYSQDIKGNFHMCPQTHVLYTRTVHTHTHACAHSYACWILS